MSIGREISHLYLREHRERFAEAKLKRFAISEFRERKLQLFTLGLSVVW